jgi:tetratricopeptide (TPR) repeat protein
LLDIEPILSQVQTGDPVGAAYKLGQLLGAGAPGRAFYEAGSIALGRREELGEEALRFARLAFAEAVERDPELGEAHHDLATTMRELGMADDAIGHYRRALELMPDDVDCLIGMGAALCDNGKVDEGISFLQRAAEKHPESGAANANLGVALEAAGRDEEAASAYAKAVARFDAALITANDDEAIEEMAARRRWARIQHAEILERLQRWPQAIVEYRRLYEEEQAVDEAELEAEEGEEGEDEDDEQEAGDDTVTGEFPMHDGETALPVEATNPAASVGGQGEAHDHDHDRDHDHDHAHEHEHEDSEDDGRVGLERLFSRLVGQGRVDLAYLVLDDLGGELADARTRATYAIYDVGDGLPTIMVEHWDTGARERMDPGAKPR